MSMRSIIGTWTLVGETAIDQAGRARPPLYGPSPLGSTTFTGNARFAAVLSDGRDQDRPVPAAFVAFCGTYRFDGRELFLRPDGATHPAMLEAPQTREVLFEGGIMILRATYHDDITRAIAWRFTG